MPAVTPPKQMEVSTVQVSLDKCLDFDKLDEETQSVIDLLTQADRKRIEAKGFMLSVKEYWSKCDRRMKEVFIELATKRIQLATRRIQFATKKSQLEKPNIEPATTVPITLEPTTVALRFSAPKKIEPTIIQSCLEGTRSIVQPTLEIISFNNLDDKTKSALELLTEVRRNIIAAKEGILSAEEYWETRCDKEEKMNLLRCAKRINIRQKEKPY